MTYQKLPMTNESDPQIYARIDVDGISRVSCTIENAEYLAWISEGNTPLPADPVPVIHVTNIKKLSFVRWCKANDKYASLLALLNSNADLKFEWDAALSLDITDPLVIGAAQVLGIADPQAVFDEIGVA